MMCEKNALEFVLSSVRKYAQELFDDKLVSVLLYGSYARGDFDSESDIDIMIIADIETGSVADYMRLLRDKVYMLEIENDCVLSLCITPLYNIEKYKNASPFYRNVLKNGVDIVK